MLFSSFLECFIVFSRESKNSNQKVDSHAINRQIRSQEVRLIDESGEMIGVIKISEALLMAETAGLDLVEISPTAEPPVCKIMDYGKFRYELQKKKQETKKKQKIVELKEIQIRPTIDKHDLEIKKKAAENFIVSGNKVKFALRFRGREITHQHIGMNIFLKIIDDFSSFSRIEQEPKMEGRQILMILAPIIK